MCLLLCRGLELAHSRCSKQLLVRGCWLARLLPLARCCVYAPASVARVQGYGLTYVLMFARMRLGLHSIQITRLKLPPFLPVRRATG